MLSREKELSLFQASDMGQLSKLEFEEVDQNHTP